MIDNEEFDISNEYKEEELGEAVHYGDLGQSRWETRHSFMSGDRDTGGFGTGVYFLSKKLDYNWENRPTHEVNINKYNLYKPKDYDHAKLLHDTLRDICNYDAGGPNIRKRNSDTDSDIDFSDYWWYTDIYDGNEIDKDIYSFALQLNRAFNYRYDTNELARIIKREMKEEKDNVSLATHILQDLGWNGVNVTDIPEMDNTTYGSVVYNLDESVDDDFRLPKKLSHYGLHAYFSGDAIIFARAFKDKEEAKNIVSVSKNECGIPAKFLPQKDKFGVYICRKGFPKDFEGWDNIEGLKEDLEKIKLKWEDINNLAKKGYESKEYFDITQTFNNDYISKYFILDDGTLLQMKDNGVHTDFHFWLYHLQNLGYDIQDFPEFNNEDEVKEYGYGHMWPLKWLWVVRAGRDIGSDDETGKFSTYVYMEFPEACHISPAQMGKIKKYLENYLDTNNEDTYQIYLSGGEDSVNYTGLTKDLNVDHLIKQIINNISYYSHNGIFKVFGDVKEDLEEKKDDHAQDAVAYFGTTNDMNIAGYLTKGGQFISLGEEGYLRGDDHRVISAIYDGDEVFDTGTDYLIDFMKEGNIRLIPEQPGIDLIKEPTQQQYSSLYRFIYYFWSHINPRKDSFIFNVSDSQGYDIGYKEFSFSENTPTKILNGIKDYYAGNLKLNEDFIDNSNKEYLLEKTRNELITKSKRGDRYKDQSKGKNRWERRTKSSIANTVDNYNKIDMDSLWKKDILDVGINVKGETDDYVVRIKLKGVIKELAEEVKANHQNYEFKCVYRAIQTVMNSDNVWVSCSCPDWQYRMAIWATNGDYNSGAPEVRPADITNPNDTKGAGCKHINLVLGNIRWIMKVCSVINNYVHYMKRVKPQLFADYIFPKIFDMPYNRAVQLDLFGDQELKSDTETISLANEYNRKLNQFKNPDEYQYYDTKDTMGQRKNPVPEKPTEQEEPSAEQHESLQLHEDTKEKTISVSQLEELAKENNQEYKFFEKVNGLANKYKEKGTYYSYWVLQDGTILECMHCHCSIECWIAQNFIINGYEVEDRDHIQPIQEEVERLYDYDFKEWNKGTKSNLSLEDFLEYAFTYCLDDGEYYAARNWGAIRITVASGILPSGTSNLIENFHIQVPEDFIMTSAQLSSTKKLLKEFIDKATLRCRVTLCSVFDQHEKRFLDFTEPDKTIDNVIQNLQVFNSSHKFRNENVDEQLSEELYKNVYHGTVVDFDKFDAKYIDWVMGGIAGFWFTDDKDFATDLGLLGGEYGAKVLIEADLLINHPIYLDINDEDKTPLTIKKENVKRFIKEVIKPKFRYTEEELDGYVNALYEDDTVTDHNILTNLLKDFNCGNEEEVLDNIYDYLGVDGYIIKNDNINETSYVVFSDSQILNRNKTYIEDELYESKQDTNNFISWFGQDLTDRFLAVRQRLKSPENDFYYWKDKTKEELEDFLTQVETTKSNTEQRKQDKEGADLLYNKSGWKVYKINTYDAAKYYGKGTKWCISGNYPGHEDEGEKYFKAYMDKGVVGYYFIFSPDNHKWCYLVYDIYHQDWPLWDEKDTGSDVPVKYNKSGETTIIRFPPEVYQVLPNASEETIEDATIYAIKNYGYLDKLYKWDETTGTLTLLKEPKEWANFSIYDIYGELQKKMVDLGLLGSAKNKEITTLNIECNTVPFALFSGASIKKINFTTDEILLEVDSFRGVDKLESINYTGKTLFIYGSFIGCSSLKSINIVADMCSLEQAFQRCSSLTTINIKADTLFMEYNPFENCNEIKQINISANNIFMAHSSYFVSYDKDDSIDFYFHLPDLKYPNCLDTGFYSFLKRHSKDNKFNDNIHITTDVKEAYIGKSMSVRAKQAYDNGEKPISKWAKQEILDTIKDLFPNLTNEQINTLQQMNVQDLKHEFLTRSSWHHTGKFYNATDFYSIDEKAIEEFFTPNQPTNEKEVDLTTIPYYEFVIYINAPYKPLGYDVVYVRTTHEEWNFGKTYEEIKSEAIGQLRRYKKSQGILYILDSSHQVIEEIKADSLDEKE